MFRPHHVILLIVALLLTGCKTDLYTGLQEREANEMLAVLLRGGISAGKLPAAEDTWNLQVEEAELASAVELLNSKGYPRQSFESMGVVFKKEGLISSPMEERIRFIYALSQEISATLTDIDGVLNARVHVVLPENNPLNKKLIPSSASVFIKYHEDADVEMHIPQIKKLVVNSIEGLTYENVTVASFPARNLEVAAVPDMATVWGMKVSPAAVMPIRALSIGLVLALLGSLGFMAWQHFKNRPSEATALVETDA